MNKKEDMLSTISKVLKQNSNFIIAFAYGSVITEFFNKNSDIDIAVLSKKHIDKLCLFNLQNELGALVNRDVSLVQITNDLSLILKNEIARKHKLLFTKDTKLSDSFIIKTPMLYEDFMFTRKKIESAYLKRNT